VDAACLAVGTVAREGSFQSGEGLWVEASFGEDWAEVGQSAEVDIGGSFSRNCGWWGVKRECGNLI
jgi:hypothetical protein